MSLVPQAAEDLNPGVAAVHLNLGLAAEDLNPGVAAVHINSGQAAEDLNPGVAAVHPRTRLSQRSKRSKRRKNRKTQKKQTKKQKKQNTQNKQLGQQEQSKQNKQNEQSEEIEQHQQHKQHQQHQTTNASPPRRGQEPGNDAAQLRRHAAAAALPSSLNAAGDAAVGLRAGHPSGDANGKSEKGKAEAPEFGAEAPRPHPGEDVRAVAP